MEVKIFLLEMYVFGGILSRILILFSFLVPALDPKQTSLYYLTLCEEVIEPFNI